MWGLFRILDDFKLVVSACVLAIINNHSMQAANQFRPNLTPSSERKRQNIFIMKSSIWSSRPACCPSCSSAASSTNLMNGSASLAVKFLYYAQASKGQRSRDPVSNPPKRQHKPDTRTMNAHVLM